MRGVGATRRQYQYRVVGASGAEKRMPALTMGFAVVVIAGSVALAATVVADMTLSRHFRALGQKAAVAS